MRKIVVANIGDQKELEFSVGSTSEFVAKAKYGDLFFSQRPAFCIDLANRLLARMNVTNIEGIKFRNFDDTKEIEVVIVVDGE